MSRPAGYYAVFRDGIVVRVCQSKAEADAHIEAIKAIEGQPAYKRFTDEISAEEFACWWNYEHPLPHR